MSSIFFLLLLLLLPFSATPFDLSTDTAALLAFRSSLPNPSVLLTSWSSSFSSSPCSSWHGVTCSLSPSRVTALRLPGSSLSGPIPPLTLSNLTALRSLSLRFNSLSSPLPSDFPQLSQLRFLSLHSNRFNFNGDVSSVIVALPNLVRLDLADNHFSGPIPLSLNNLTRLKSLFLQNNNFSGQIPQNLSLPNLVDFNVSFNSLNASSIPKSLQTMPTSAFLGMPLCGRPLPPCNVTTVSPSPAPAPAPAPAAAGSGGGGLSGGAIAGIAIGAVVLLLLLVLVLVLLCRMKKSRKGGGAEDVAATAAAVAAKPAEVGGGRGGGSEVKKLVFFGGGEEEEFDLEDLLRASAEVLGKGTYGTTYKAVMEKGAVVAVKRLKDVGMLSEREFKEKVEGIGGMEHGCLVRLKAYYFSKDEKLLVYNYMQNGSLSSLLHGNRGSGRAPLNWETRSGIALAAANGLAYIHSTSPTNSHGNIKSSNILLGKSHEDARVSDHGLAYLVGSAAPSAPARASGYRAPEVTDPCKISQKADVYSFGILLLELLTGKAPAHALLNEEGVDLPHWVKSVVREEWTSEVFDSDLLRYQNVEEEMVQLLTLAIECSEQYPDGRPSMSQVVTRIEDIRKSSTGSPNGADHSSKQTDDSIDEAKSQNGD